MRDAVRLRKILDQSGGGYRNILVINRHGEGGRNAVSLDEIQNLLEMPPRNVIPFQPSLFTAAAGGAKIAAAQRGKFTDAIAAARARADRGVVAAAALVGRRVMRSAGLDGESSSRAGSSFSFPANRRRRPLRICPGVTN